MNVQPKFSHFQEVILIAIVASFCCVSVSYAKDYSSCVKCHASKPDLSRKYVHPAVKMGCTVCHSRAHKKGTTGPMGLSAAVPELCFNCHGSDSFRGKVVHPPVSGGMCLFCHDPHSSDNAYLLKQKVPVLCYNCHGKFDKKVVHPPVAAGQCMACHTPHAGPNRDLLLKPLNDLCIECHPKVPGEDHVNTFGGGHPLFFRSDPKHPGHEFNCLSRHNAHDSKWIKLFRFKDTDPDGFELCAHCHRF